MKMNLILIALFSFFTVACASETRAVSQVGSVSQNMATETPDDTIATSNPEQTPSLPEKGNTASQTFPTDAAPGQADGAMSKTSSAQNQPSSGSGVTSWELYRNAQYHFQIRFPAYLQVKEFDSTGLAQFTPMPIAVVHFLDPRGDVASFTPPVFSIHIFGNSKAQSLTEWLKTAELYNPAAGQLIEPYQNQHISGFQVSSTNYMAPGVFVYVSREGSIYQLIPLGTEAELMLESFVFTP